jgi:glycine/D-amino acid oxidase-like deaminating enzyme
MTAPAGGTRDGGTSPVGWDIDPSVADRLPLPQLDEDVTADVCVVGLGGSGLAAVADALARGLSVVGVDAGRVGAGAAGRNGGILSATPGVGFSKAAAAWGLESLAAFRAAACAEIDGLARILGPEVVHRVGGVRLIEPTWAPEGVSNREDIDGEWADVEQQRRVLEAVGGRSERYSGPLGEGVFFPDEAAMNPARRVVDLAAIVGRQARLYERSPVLAIDDRVVVRTSRGAVTAGTVVVAVDGRLSKVLPELGSRVRPIRLQMLASEPMAPGRLPCPVHLRWGFDYAQQDATGRLYIGGGRDHDMAAEETESVEPTSRVQGWIEAQAARLMGAGVVVTHRWAASAGYTDNGMPVVAMPRRGVVACGGYCGTGNVVGMLASKAALRWCLDGTRPPAWFDVAE